MAGTNLYANWSGVTYNSIAITKVDDVSFDHGGSLQAYAGDTDRFETVLVALMTQPKATVSSSNTFAIMSLGPPGATTAILLATHVDAKLVVGQGAQYTLANAVFENASTNGAHASFGRSQAHFRSFSSDGTTDPLSMAHA